MGQFWGKDEAIIICDYIEKNGVHIQHRKSTQRNRWDGVLAGCLLEVIKEIKKRDLDSLTLKGG